MTAGRNALLATGAILALATAPAHEAGAAALPQGPTVAGASGGAGATFNYSVANTLTVNQSAQRVVIDWRSFSIGAGGTVNFNQASPNFVAFNIVQPGASGLSPLSVIDGALNARGGVWLFSTGGVLFGAGAVVNVGSFAAVTGPLSAAGGINQLLNPGANGLTTVTLDPPLRPGVETLTVDSGARINAASGFVVLQSETMSQSGAITAFDGVDYTVAETGQIIFATSASGAQLQSADALAVAGKDQPSFSHTGSTSAAWVGIDTPGGALKPGYHDLINLGGLVDASGMKPGTVDGVVLLVGDSQGPAYPGYTGSSMGVDARGATINAAAGMEVVSDSASLGKASLGGALVMQTYGGIDFAGPITTGGSALLSSAAGAIAFNANLTADDTVLASGSTITVGPKVTVRSDALGDGAGGVNLHSATDLTADPTSLLVAGAVGATPTGSVSVRAGSHTQGGDIALGGVSGTQVYVQSHSAGAATKGAITLAGSVDGTQSVTVLVGDVTTAGQPAGGLQILGKVQSPGYIDLEDLGPGAFTVGPGAQVSSSGGQVFLYSGGDTTISNGASVSGVSLLDHTLGALTIASGASVSTTGTSSALIGPIIPFGSEFQRASGLNLAAANMVIDGTVVAGGSQSSDDIYIEALGPAGATAVIGGAAGGSGFDLSNASFGNLHARNVVIMGGPGEAAGAGANLQIADLTLDPAKLSSLWLGTASGADILVSGRVTSLAGTPVNVELGFARLGSGGAYSGGPLTNPGVGGLDGFVPGKITITGALGASGAPLGAVAMIAKGDILVGDQAFVTAAAADANFNAQTASASYPGFASGQVFIASASLQLASEGRIIQQNTGAGGAFGGLESGAPTAALPLVFSPAALQGQAIGGGVWTADFATGPSRVDLFGSLTPAGSGAVADRRAAGLPDLLDPAIATRAAYAFNSCAFGQSCVAATTGATTFVPPELVDLAAPGAPGGPGSSGGADVSTPGAPGQPALADQAAPQSQLGIALADQAASGAQGALAQEFALSNQGAARGDIVAAFTATQPVLAGNEDRLGLANPITETGNGDLWGAAEEPCGASDADRANCPKP